MSLKVEPPDAKEFAGLKRSGHARLNDALNTGLSLEGRFDLAYNAAHALCLAALRRRGFRPANRYIVFQVLPHTLGLGPEVWRVMSKCHDSVSFRGTRPEQFAAIIRADRALVQRSEAGEYPSRVNSPCAPRRSDCEDRSDRAGVANPVGPGVDLARAARARARGRQGLDQPVRRRARATSVGRAHPGPGRRVGHYIATYRVGQVDAPARLGAFYPFARSSPAAGAVVRCFAHPRPTSPIRPSAAAYQRVWPCQTRCRSACRLRRRPPRCVRMGFLATPMPCVFFAVAQQSLVQLLDMIPVEGSVFPRT